DRESRRLASPLFLYKGGELAAATDALLDDLAPVGRLLDPEVATSLLVHGEVATNRVERISRGTSSTLFGYRALETASGEFSVLAAPARTDDLALEHRARDLGILVMCATACWIKTSSAFSRRSTDSTRSRGPSAAMANRRNSAATPSLRTSRPCCVTWWNWKPWVRATCGGR